MSVTVSEAIDRKHSVERTLADESTAIKGQLSKIDSLEDKIRQMQLQLNCLAKIEKTCDKSNQEGVNTTLLTIRNRVNISQTHLFTENRHLRELKKCTEVKEKVKQMRDKDIEDLRNAKRSNQEEKENMMREIKQMSVRNESIIRKRKQQQLQKNRMKANEIKSDKESYKRSLVESQIKEIQEKHQFSMHQSRMRLALQSELEVKLHRLTEQKAELQKRVQQKKEYKEKLRIMYKQIGKMDDKQVQKTILRTQKRIREYEKNKKTTTNRPPTKEDEESEEDYVKNKMFEKYLERQQKKRAEAEMLVY